MISRQRGAHKSFFAILPSPILDGFYQLLSFLHCPLVLSSALSINAATCEKNSGAVVRTRAGWVWSVNATSALCRPPCIEQVFKQVWRFHSPIYMINWSNLDSRSSAWFHSILTHRVLLFGAFGKSIRSVSHPIVKQTTVGPWKYFTTGGTTSSNSYSII